MKNFIIRLRDGLLEVCLLPYKFLKILPNLYMAIVGLPISVLSLLFGGRTLRSIKNLYIEIYQDTLKELK